MAIEVERLVKLYHRRERRPGAFGAVAGLFSRRRITTRALDGVSFAVGDGELLGYIGPNGAGKSTTIKILSGILVPEEGRCVVDGRVPWKERREHVRRIGVVFGQRTQLWWDLPVIESFELLRDIYRLDAADYRAARDELVERLSLAAVLDQPVRQLSLGQRMRADLAASLLHRPRLLFLDEPTIGLDAPGKLAVRQFLAELNRETGLTVILTTHDMDDIEALCTRLLVIGGGRILADGSPRMLQADLSIERRITVDVEPPATDTRMEAMVRAAGGRFERTGAGGAGRAGSWEATGGRIVITADPSRLPVPLLVEQLSRAFHVHDLFVEAAPIEEIVSRIYAQQRSEPASPGARTQ